MSGVIKCDRCGKITDPKETRMSFKVGFTAYKFAERSMFTPNLEIDSDVVYDLCKECHDELFESVTNFNKIELDVERTNLANDMIEIMNKKPLRGI